MKPRCSKQRNRALTLTEVLVVILVLILAVVLLPIFTAANRRPNTINCVNNVKQVCLSFRIWAEDNNGKYPMEISTANGGTMELAATGDAVTTFQAMSNELSTPKVLFCWGDTRRVMTAHFGSSLTAKNVSYFIGLDAATNYSQAFLTGDDNFAIGGIPVNSGLLGLSTNLPIAWTSGRHVTYNSHFWTPARTKFYGNVGLCDGSVGSLTVQSLQQALQNTGVATNRLAIP